MTRPRILWGAFWAGVLGLWLGALYLVPHVKLPPIIGALPLPFVKVAAAMWLSAGVWALVSAFLPRCDNHWPTTIVGSLCVGWAVLYGMSVFTAGSNALFGVVFFVVFAGFVFTKTRVAVIIRQEHDT